MAAYNGPLTGYQTRRVWGGRLAAPVGAPLRARPDFDIREEIVREQEHTAWLQAQLTVTMPRTANPGWSQHSAIYNSLADTGVWQPVNHAAAVPGLYRHRRPVGTPGQHPPGPDYMEE